MKKTILISFAFFILSQQSAFTGQWASERDSLRAVVFDKNLHDTIRLKAGFDFVWTYIYEIPDSALYFSRMFYEESVKADYVSGIISFRMLEGWYYTMVGNAEEALKHFLAALERAEGHDDPGLLAAVYTAAAQGYLGFRQYDRMGEYLMQALKIYSELNETENEIATMGSLAYVYAHTGHRQKAMDTYLRIIELVDSAKVGYADIKPNALYRLGHLYLDFDQPVEAIKSYHEALTIYKQNNNVVIYHHILYNMAYFFMEDTLNLYGKEIGDDRRSVDIALAYAEELESWFGQAQDSMILSELYILGAKAYLIKGEKQKALEKLKAAEEMKHVARNLPHEIFYYKSLAEIYEEYGDLGHALNYYKNVITLKDSVKEVEMAEKVRQLTESFEIEQMEGQLSQKEQQLEKNRVITRLFIAVSALILALAAIVSYFLRQKQKQNREIEKARIRAEQSEKFKERFLATMSHEIRTPLNAVIGMTGLLLDEPQPAKTGAFLHNIRQAGEHLTGIINQILDLSRIDAGKLDLNEAPFGMQELLDDIGNLLSGKAKDKGLQLIIYKDEATPNWLYGDAGRIRQVLLNLADNAVKFTEQGSVQVKISSGDRMENKAMVRFSVEDTGIGIPKELQATIFEEFVQAGQRQEQRIVGTGLGLSIARKLVGRMDGKLALESEPGRGSVFSFTLPLELSTEAAFHAHQKEKELPVMTIKGSFRILVVEDNPSNRIVTEGLLEKILPESAVIFAEDGFKALALLEKEKFDLALMDIRMPGIDGYETTGRLRQLDNENASIPVIALTASVIRSDIQHCLEAGMNGYVPKPISRDFLAKTLHEHLKVLADEDAVRQEPEAENFLTGISERPAWADRLYETCNGKKDRFIRYLEVLLKDSRAAVEQWQEWTDRRQHETLAFSIHKLLPHIRLFLNDKMSAQASLLDQELRKGWSEGYAEDIQALRTAMITVQQEALALLEAMDQAG